MEDKGRCYRGSGLPDEHKAFFRQGLKFRVPGFLATSFKMQATCAHMHVFM